MFKTKKLMSLLMVAVLMLAMTALAAVPVAAAGTMKVYFEDSLSWGSINCYYWGGADTIQWPGIACTEEGDGIWSAEIPSDVTGVVFNGNGSQTADLKNEGGNKLAKLTGNAGATGFGDAHPEAVWTDYTPAPAQTPEATEAQSSGSENTGAGSSQTTQKPGAPGAVTTGQELTVVYVAIAMIATAAIAAIIARKKATGETCGR